MKKNFLMVILTFIITIQLTSAQQKAPLQETKEEFDTRMKWFKDAKYGMFIHFGLYSQLGGVWKGESIPKYAEWLQANADISPQEYALLAHHFNPKDFNAEAIVKLAKKAGMKYIVITTKHHEGFCLWDSKYTSFDVGNSPFKRDILKELSDACRKHGIKFGTYYSLFDWHHPSQEKNSVNKGKDDEWPWANNIMKQGQKTAYVNYMKNQVKELIDLYNTDLIWFDGDWVGWWTLEDGLDLYTYIRELKPNIIINNRVAKRKSFTKDYGTPEQFHFDSAVDYEWEACYTLNDNWGFKKNDSNWKSPEKVYQMLQDINGKGGNFLLNIGPDGDGKVPEKSKEILLQVGKMLEADNKK
ncbi:alpha-L-fucosidase [Pedobacter puniceum]|uniref:alpha-L-fucosidase n=1 Tax=Pedobacter puniceum TaxID=2666136 RepID=A0A7K0FM51_9SPHI|nr:alpha-L-fucosidase [Pedobacter puniceum]MRX47003.1 alpha-L-fucosidase [Pedobacter puniceum]